MSSYSIHKHENEAKTGQIKYLKLTSELERKTGESSSVVGLRPGGIVK